MVKLFRFEPTSAVACKLCEGVDYAVDGSARIFCSPLRAPWGDCVPTKCMDGPMIVSQRVADAIERSNLVGVALRRVEARLRRGGGEVRAYYAVSPVLDTPSLVYRLWKRVGDNEFSFAMEASCRSDITEFRRKNKISVVDVHPQVDFVGSTLAGDFFKAPDMESGVYLSGGFLCSRRVVEIAYAEGWTNLSFTPIDSFSTMAGNVKDNAWPPESWYPLFQPKIEREREG